MYFEYVLPTNNKNFLFVGAKQKSEYIIFTQEL